MLHKQKIRIQSMDEDKNNANFVIVALQPFCTAKLEYIRVIRKNIVENHCMLTPW